MKTAISMRNDNDEVVELELSDDNCSISVGDPSSEVMLTFNGYLDDIIEILSRFTKEVHEFEAKAEAPESEPE